MKFVPRLLLLCALLMLPTAANAQQRDTTLQGTGKAGATNTEDGNPPSTDQMRPDEQMGTSGFFLGLVSVLAGATVGSQYGQQHCPRPLDQDRDCISRHGYTGAMIAATVMVPVGVHLVNRHPKNFLQSIGLSTAIGSALYFGTRAIPGKPIALGAFLSIPLQVYTSVKVEGSGK